MQIKLQQAQAAKALSENTNKVLQVCFLMKQFRVIVPELKAVKITCSSLCLAGGFSRSEGADHSV